jgi:hypothetical protein
MSRFILSILAISFPANKKSIIFDFMNKENSNIAILIEPERPIISIGVWVMH